MGLFTKSSPKKKTEPDPRENHSSSSRSSPRKSPTKSSAKSSPNSPTKSFRPKEQTYRQNSWSRSTTRRHHTSDIHPLNLPPEERERRRSEMSSDGEQDEEMYQMDVDSDDSSEPHQHTNGMSNHEQVNGDGGPVPPPHQTPSPPPKPAYDPEACKATGNKYFKAKDFTRAIQEYTKGQESSHKPSNCRLESCTGLADIWCKI